MQIMRILDELKKKLSYFEKIAERIGCHSNRCNE